MKLDTVLDVKIGPGRIEDLHPKSFRLAQYPSGEKRLQGSYQWSCGPQWGIEWKDIPLVYVGNDGVEIKYASGMVK